MIELFFIYAVIAAIATVLWFQFVVKGCPEQDLEAIMRECRATKRQVVISVYVLLILFGWLWFPYAIVGSLVNAIKGKGDN